MRYAVYLLLARILETTFFEIFPIENAGLWANFFAAYLDFVFLMFFDSKCKKDLRKLGTSLINNLIKLWKKWEEFVVYVIINILDLLIYILTKIANLFLSLRNSLDSQ